MSTAQSSTDMVFVWHAVDVAKRADLCFICSKVYRPGERIAFFGVPGPRGWSKGHLQCAWDDQRMVEKPEQPPADVIVRPTSVPRTSGSRTVKSATREIIRIVAERAEGQRGGHYLVMIDHEVFLDETDYRRAEGAAKALKELRNRPDLIEQLA